MNPQKEFKIASIFLLFLGVIDAILVGMEWFSPDSSLFKTNIFLVILFAVMSVFTLAKLYMGIMGLKYCNGTGKGRLHITLAKIGVLLGIVSIVISVIDLINGTGTVQTVIGDAFDIFVIWWYFDLAKKNYA